MHLVLRAKNDQVDATERVAPATTAAAAAAATTTTVAAAAAVEEDILDGGTLGGAEGRLGGAKGWSGAAVAAAVEAILDGGTETAAPLVWTTPCLDWCGRHHTLINETERVATPDRPLAPPNRPSASPNRPSATPAATTAVSTTAAAATAPVEELRSPDGGTRMTARTAEEQLGGAEGRLGGAKGRLDVAEGRLGDAEGRSPGGGTGVATNSVIGRAVRKRFVKYGWYDGKVVGHRVQEGGEERFRVAYSDGDTEEFSRHDLHKYLVGSPGPTSASVG